MREAERKVGMDKSKGVDYRGGGQQAFLAVLYSCSEFPNLDQSPGEERETRRNAAGMPTKGALGRVHSQYGRGLFKQINCATVIAASGKDPPMVHPGGSFQRGIANVAC